MDRPERPAGAPVAADTRRLLAALAGYAARLAECGLGGVDVPGDDAQPGSVARAIAQWRRLRPHRAAAALLRPDQAHLAELAAECRAAGRSRLSAAQAAVAGRAPGLLERCAQALELAAAASSGGPNMLDALGEADDAVTAALGELTPDCVEVGLAGALRSLADDWPEVSARDERAFAPALAQLLERVADRPELPPALAADVAAATEAEFETAAPPGWAALMARLEAHAPPGSRRRLEPERLPPGLRAGLPAELGPAEWLAWTRTEPGSEWLNAAAADAAGRAWLGRALRLSGGELIPGAEWPGGLSSLAPGVRLAASPLPAGAVAAAERFATSPDLARLTLSLGPHPAELVAAAAQVWEGGRDVPGVAAILAGPVAASLGEVPPAPEELGPLLDALADAEVPAARLPALVSAARRWLAAAGLALLPGEPGGPATGVEEVLRFRAADPAGSLLRVSRYGLADRSGGVLRSAAVSVSAGPAPAGLPELLAACAAAPEALRAELEPALATWRAAGRRGELGEAVVAFFERFWGEWHPAWRAADRAGGGPDDAAEALRVVAQSAGLSPFEPARLQDYPPRWVRLPPGARPTTGRVLRVTAPGLVDATGALRVAAAAEVE